MNLQQTFSLEFGHKIIKGIRGLFPSLYGIFDILKVFQYLVFDSVLYELRNTFVCFSGSHLEGAEQFVVDGDSCTHVSFSFEYILASLHRYINMTTS
jgi:hypothetical protein